MAKKIEPIDDPKQTTFVPVKLNLPRTEQTSNRITALEAIAELEKAIDAIWHRVYTQAGHGDSTTDRAYNLSVRKWVDSSIKAANGLID